MDMIATTFVIRFSSSRMVPMTTFYLHHERRHADTTTIHSGQRLGTARVDPPPAISADGRQTNTGSPRQTGCVPKARWQ
jgi:hypothetical protein